MNGCMAALPPAAGSKAGLTLPAAGSKAGLTLPELVSDAFQRRRADAESIQNKARKFLLRGECIISLILMRIPRLILSARF